MSYTPASVRNQLRQAATLGLMALLSSATLAQVPQAALEHRSAMTRSAYRIHGPGAPVATLAAQIHQESGWNPTIKSWVGAEGLAQFMPGTANDIARQFPTDCAPANPTSPAWAFACRDRLMRQLVGASSRAVGGGPVSACSTWAFAFRGYNGGPGWMLRDRRKALANGANPDDWQAVRPFNAGRNANAIKENREYPERIYRRERLYLTAGWGAGLQCL